MADAAAQYKKQDGRVSVSADGKTVSWKSSAASNAHPPLSIAIADIGSTSWFPYQHIFTWLTLRRSPTDTCDLCKSLHQDCCTRARSTSREPYPHLYLRRRSRRSAEHNRSIAQMDRGLQTTGCSRPSSCCWCWRGRGRRRISCNGHGSDRNSWRQRQRRKLRRCEAAR